MKTLKQEYRQFLTDNFETFIFRQPLYFRWKFGLRFNLQVGEAGSDEYFEEVNKRANKIFQSSFAQHEQLFIVFIDFKYKRRKIRLTNYTFKQIKDLKKGEISYSKAIKLYEPNDKFDIRNIALIKLPIDRINYGNILAAIANSDFPPRRPRLDKNGVFTNKEIYFINIDKKLIFHMYDDRGLDIISADLETLRPIYKNHNDWILEFNRSEIDKQFENRNGI